MLPCPEDGRCPSPHYAPDTGAIIREFAEAVMLRATHARPPWGDQRITSDLIGEAFAAELVARGITLS